MRLSHIYNNVKAIPSIPPITSLVCIQPKGAISIDR